MKTFEQNFVDCLVELLDTGYSVRINDETITITYLDDEEHKAELYYNNTDRLKTKDDSMLPQSMVALLKIGEILKKERS